MEQLAQRKKKIVIGVSRNTRNHQSMGKTELKAGIRLITN